MPVQAVRGVAAYGGSCEFHLREGRRHGRRRRFVANSVEKLTVFMVTMVQTRWMGAPVETKTSVRAVQHHPALPYAELPSFWTTLAAEDVLSADALRFTILTAARTNEVVPMAWPEVDFDAAVWTVPPARMKGKKNKSREHRVPLSKPALAVLRARYALTGAVGYVFPGKPKRPMSNMAMLKMLERMGRTDITGHGFRSTFRDWVEETTNYAGTVAEAALAHVVGDKVEAAYRPRGLIREAAPPDERLGELLHDAGRIRESHQHRETDMSDGNAITTEPVGALTVNEFCDSYRVGRNTFYNELKAGRLEARKAGKKTLVLKSEAQRGARALPKLAATGRLLRSSPGRPQ